MARLTGDTISFHFWEGHCTILHLSLPFCGFVEHVDSFLLPKATLLLPVITIIAVSSLAFFALVMFLQSLILSVSISHNKHSYSCPSSLSLGGPEDSLKLPLPP